MCGAASCNSNEFVRDTGRSFHVAVLAIHPNTMLAPVSRWRKQDLHRLSFLKSRPGSLSIYRSDNSLKFSIAFCQHDRLKLPKLRLPPYPPAFAPVPVHSRVPRCPTRLSLLHLMSKSSSGNTVLHKPALQPSQSSLHLLLNQHSTQRLLKTCPLPPHPPSASALPRHFYVSGAPHCHSAPKFLLVVQQQGVLAHLVVLPHLWYQALCPRRGWPNFAPSSAEWQ